MEAYKVWRQSDKVKDVIDMVTENVTLSPDDDSITYRGQHLQLEACGLFGAMCVSPFWGLTAGGLFWCDGCLTFSSTDARTDGQKTDL